MDRGILRRFAAQRRRRARCQPSGLRRRQFHRGCGLRLVVGGDLHGRQRTRDRAQQRRCRRWHRHRAVGVRFPVLFQDAGAVAGRPAAHFRPGRQRHRDQRRARRDRDEAPGGCGARRRSRLRRDQGRCRFLGRQGAGHDRATPGRADARADPCLCQGGLLAVDHQHGRSARYRDAGRRPRRGADHHRVPAIPGRGGQERGHRFGQDPARPHQGQRRCRRPDQGGHVAVSPYPAGPLRRRKSDRHHRRSGFAGLPAEVAAPLDRRFTASAPRRRLRLRFWRHQFSRRARRVPRRLRTAGRARRAELAV